MRFKLDENLSRHLKEIFPPLGHEASTAGDEHLLSQPDSAIAAAARSEGRILLTLDVEFANLKKYAPGTHPGIFVFRPHKFSPVAVNLLVEQFLRTTNVERLKGCLVIIEPSRARIRWPSAPAEI